MHGCGCAAGGEFTVHGAPVFITEQPNMGQGTGLTVWDGVRQCASFPLFAALLAYLAELVRVRWLVLLCGWTERGVGQVFGEDVHPSAGWQNCVGAGCWHWLGGHRCVCAGVEACGADGPSVCADQHTSQCGGQPAGAQRRRGGLIA